MTEQPVLGFDINGEVGQAWKTMIMIYFSMSGFNWREEEAKTGSQDTSTKDTLIQVRVPPTPSPHYNTLNACGSNDCGVNPTKQSDCKQILNWVTTNAFIIT
jgi:hypothetical protein